MRDITPFNYQINAPAADFVTIVKKNENWPPLLKNCFGVSSLQMFIYGTKAFILEFPLTDDVIKA
jgi:hypothetical protein